MTLLLIPAGAFCAPALASATETVGRLAPDGARGVAIGLHSSALMAARRSPRPCPASSSTPSPRRPRSPPRRRRHPRGGDRRGRGHARPHPVTQSGPTVYGAREHLRRPREEPASSISRASRPSSPAARPASGWPPRRRSPPRAGAWWSPTCRRRRARRSPRTSAGEFVAADVTDADALGAAVAAAEAAGPFRALVHCAGIGSLTRVVEKNGDPGDMESFERVIRVNLFGSFNALRLAGAGIARTEPVNGERGAMIMTASVAAFEGQIGQMAYCRVEGRRRVDDAVRRARPRVEAGPRQHDRARAVRHPAVRDALGRGPQDPRRVGAQPPPPGRPRRVRADGGARCSRTPCSTARRSGSTARSGCPA